MNRFSPVVLSTNSSHNIILLMKSLQPIYGNMSWLIEWKKLRLTGLKMYLKKY